MPFMNKAIILANNKTLSYELLFEEKNWNKKTAFTKQRNYYVFIL